MNDGKNNAIDGIPLTVDRPNTVPRYLLLKVSKVIMESVMECLRKERSGAETTVRGMKVSHDGCAPDDILKELDENPQVYEGVVTALLNDLERSGCVTIDEQCSANPLKIDNPIVRFNAERGFSAILRCGTAGEATICLTDFHGYIVKCAPRAEP